VEKEFLVNGDYKRLNIPDGLERAEKGKDLASGSRAKVRGLANLAGSFRAAFSMGVAKDLRGKHNEQKRQSQCKNPDPGQTRLLLAYHFDDLHYLNLPLDAKDFPW
jgi:hypothetical protein